MVVPLDAYLNSQNLKPTLSERSRLSYSTTLLLQGLHRLFPAFLPEQIRQLSYYSALGQFLAGNERYFLLICLIATTTTKFNPFRRWLTISARVSGSSSFADHLYRQNSWSEL